VGDSIPAIEEKGVDVEFFVMPSRELMESALANRYAPALGLALPADLSYELQGDRTIEIDGYVLYGVSETAAQDLVALTEQEMGELLDHAVHIHLSTQRVYPKPGARGHSRSVSTGLLFVLLSAGLSVLTYMMVEEKQTRTLDALVVSPASSGELVLAKVLAGLAFCLVAAAITLVLNLSPIVHWGILILAILCGALFSSAIGVLVGTFVESNQQIGVWLLVLFVALIAPAQTIGFEEMMPEMAKAALQWMPTVALAQLFQASLIETVPLMQTAARLALVCGYTAVLLAATIGFARRVERQ
jgi:ABC-2 type transport system permease protein